MHQLEDVSEFSGTKTAVGGLMEPRRPKDLLVLANHVKGLLLEQRDGIWERIDSV